MNARRAVAIVRHSFYPFELNVKREAEALRDVGFDVHVICLRGRGELPLETIEGVNVYRLPVEHRRGKILRYMWEYNQFFVLASSKLARLHRAHRFAAVQVNTMPDSLVFAALYPNKVAGLLLMDPSSFVHDDSSLAMAGMPAVVVRLMQARAINKMRRGLVAAARDPQAKAKFIKETSASFGPRYPKDRMERDMGLGVDLSFGEATLHSAVARVGSLGRLGSHYCSTTAEVARTVAEHGGLPKVPTLLLLSTWFGTSPPPKDCQTAGQEVWRV